MNRTKKPLVVSIVLTWNSSDFIAESLQSLINSTYDTNILVIDNNSSDNTRELITEKFPNIRLVNSGDNLGYAGGNNFGIEIARKLNPDYIFILNPDAQVSPDCIEKMVNRLESDPTTGIASPLVYFSDTKRVWYGGSSMKWRTGERIQTVAEDNGQYADLRYTDFASGCAMLIRMEAIHSVGVMDARYFLYCEETDWSLQFTKKGYKVGIVPTAKVWHKASASTGGFYSPLCQYYLTRNRLLLLSKHRPSMLPVMMLSSIYITFFRLITITKLHGVHQAFVCMKSIAKANVDFFLGKFGRQTIPS